MGFGTLFIGYFFLINISYFGYTDVIAALVMLLGLYKLSSVNRDFYRGMIASLAFSIFALAELLLTALDIFIDAGTLSTVTSFVGAGRYAFIFILTLYILRGIKEVALEVEAYELNDKAKRSIPMAIAFLIAFVLEMPLIGDLLGGFTPYIYFAMLLFIVIYIVFILSVIYKAYMQICMPEDLKPKSEKKSSGVFNKFYENIEKSGKEYAEYKLKKQTEKKNKRNNKNDR